MGKVSVLVITSKDFATGDNIFTSLHNTSYSFIPGMQLVGYERKGIPYANLEF